MKNHSIISVLLACIVGIGNILPVHATQYYRAAMEDKSGTGKTVYISLIKTQSSAKYQLVFESDDVDLTSSGNNTCYSLSGSSVRLDAKTGNDVQLLNNKHALVYFWNDVAPVFNQGPVCVKSEGGQEWQLTLQSEEWLNSPCSGYRGHFGEGYNALIYLYYETSYDGDTKEFKVTCRTADNTATFNYLKLRYQINSGAEDEIIPITEASSKVTETITITGVETGDVVKFWILWGSSVIDGQRMTSESLVTADVLSITAGNCDAVSPSPSPEPACEGKHFYYVKIGDTAYTNVYMWESSNTANKNAEWPGVAMSKTVPEISLLGALIYEISYEDANYDKVIFNDGASNQTSDLDIKNCQFYMDGTWYSSIEDIEAQMVYFVNTPNWSDANVKANIWKNGGSVLGTSELMHYTGATTDQGNYKVFYYYNKNLNNYDRIQFHNGSNYSGEKTLEKGNYFNYADNLWYTSTKYLNFSSGGWSLIPFEWTDFSHTVQTCVATISDASVNYEFNIKSAGSSYYYNHGTMDASNCTNWKFDANSSANCWIDPDVAGDYLFQYDFAENKLSVTYPPYMTSASLDTKTSTTAIINVTSTRGTKYRVVDASEGINQVLTPAAGKVTVTDLTPGTQYTFTVTALDNNDTESTNSVELSAFYTLPTITSASFSSARPTTITLNVAGSGASQYHVTATGIDQKLTPSDGKITITGLAVNTSYNFTVKAVNAGNEDSSESIAVNSVSTLKDTPTDVAALPTAISSLDACQVGGIYGMPSPWTNKGFTTYQGWGGAAATSTSIAGRDVLQQISSTTSASEFAQFDLTYPETEYDKIHFDIWTIDAENLELILLPNDGGYHEGDYERVAFSTTAQGWTSVDMNLSSFLKAGSTDEQTNRFYQHLALFYVYGLSNSSKYYFTNICLYRSTTCPYSSVNRAQGADARSGWSRTVTEPNAGEIPIKAVDGDLTTNHIHWNIGDAYTTRGWWAVDLGASYVLKDLYIYWQNVDGRVPQSYEIQVAIGTPTDFVDDHVMDDDTHWRTIQTVSGVTQNRGTTPNILSYTIGEYVTARYIRLVNKDADNKTMALSEFKVFAHSGVDCAAANTPTASFAGIEGGRIKLNLSATNTSDEALTDFAVLYDGVYYDVTASEGVGYLTLPTHRNITVRVYAYDKCMQKSTGYVDVLIGDYVNPVENLAELKTTWVSYTNSNADEKQANLNDGVLDNNGWIPYQNTGKNAWMVVDLGDTYQISTIQTFFATDRKSTNYKIYGRQEDPSTDLVRGDNTQWVELASKSSSINAGTTESDVNESAISFTGAIRYVRFESFAEEWSDAENGFKLLEFRVFGSAYKDRDLTGPVISTCEIDASAENETSTILHLVANDAVDGEVFNYEISTDGGSSWTRYTTNTTTRLVTISPLVSGSYTFTVRAYDIVSNYSENRTVSVDIWDPTVNLALNKTCYAGHETNNEGESKEKANDGNLETFWTSWNGANPGDDWWCVDLGAYYQLSEIDVFWNKAEDDNLHSESYSIRVRQSLSGTASEIEAIQRDSTLWYPIVQQTTTPNVGNTESDKNAYTLNTPARYVLLKSRERNSLNQQIRLGELRAFGSGFASADTHIPVITSATVNYNNDGKAYLTLTATDEEDGTTNWFRIYNPYTHIYSLQQTNGSSQIVIDGLPTCTDYPFRIQAMDKSAQLSAVTDIIVNVPIISTFNLARGKNTSAEVSENADNGANAVDGNLNNQWSGNTGARADGVNQWMYVDLGEKFSIHNVNVRWGEQAGAWPQDYELQVSYDGTNFQPVAHYTSVSASRDNSCSLTDVCAQYVRVWANKAGVSYGMTISELEVNGDCYQDTELPIMLFAEAGEEDVYKTSVRLYVGAIHKTIPSNELLYHIDINNGARAVTVAAAEVVNNYITLTGLTGGTDYTLKIYAAKTSDTEENRSANYRTVSFTTLGEYSDFYLANTINGWLAVNGGEWTDAMNEWRFKTTGTDGIYNLSHAVNETGIWTYLIYNRAAGTRTPGDRTASVTSGRDFQAVMRDFDHYVTNYSHIYVAGSAVGTAENARTCELEWIDATHAVWQGRVTTGGTYRITSYDNVLQTDFITPTEQTFSNTWTHAKLTFTFDNEAGFTWSWEEIPSAQFCSHSGAEGSGAVIDGAAFGADESYSIYAYMSAGGKWVVEAMCNGITADVAYLQPYTAATGIDRQEFSMTKTSNYFRAEIDPASITYKSDNIVRYVVKFAVEAGIRYTDIHYYDFSDGGACAPDYFDIYHYDDAPVGARTEYAGGTILQPIRYFRHFEHTEWCAIAFPFEVSKVVVEEDGTEYPLYPRFNNGSEDVEGYYWLKTFADWSTTPVAISAFQSAWQQLTVSTSETEDEPLSALVKPAKDVPYVIAFTDGPYYETNWVIFYGAGGQTIAAAEDDQCAANVAGEAEQVKLQRNNMMKPTASKENIYLIEEQYNIYSRRTQAVPAFESYVVGTAPVQNRYRVLRFRGENTPEVTTGLGGLPTTEYKGEIYSSTGVLVADFADRDAMERHLNSLPTGVYMVRCGNQVNKVVVR